MKADVQKVVQECEVCQRRKVEKQLPTGEMHSFEVYEPNKAVAVDTIGPLSNSLNNHNQHIIVAIDMFTRHIEAKAVPRIDSASYASFLVEYCGRYGVPESILSDNAPTFVNAFVRELSEILEIKHLTTTPHHSRANAIVERVIQSLQDKLALVLDSQTDTAHWDVVLPVAVLNVNTSFHKSLGYSPFELTYGNRPILTGKEVATETSTPLDLQGGL